jgi:hypothetical protein
MISHSGTKTCASSRMTQVWMTVQCPLNNNPNWQPKEWYMRGYHPSHSTTLQEMPDQGTYKASPPHHDPRAGIPPLMISSTPTLAKAWHMCFKPHTSTLQSNRQSKQLALLSKASHQHVSALPHSLWAGGVVAMHLNKIDHDRTWKMGHWSSDIAILNVHPWANCSFLIGHFQENVKRNWMAQHRGLTFMDNPVVAAA